jgi:hypothetical protein
MMRQIVKWALIVGVLFVTADLFLLVSGRRVLISERLVRPGENFVVGEWGDLGANENASLVCRYFTGRSTVTRVLWYSPNNILGRDSCPTITSELE